MKLTTKYHGTIEYNDKDIITFEKGIPGFQDLRKFIIFPVENNNIFNILHSIENHEVGLVVVSPFIVDKDYEFNISDNELKELEIYNQHQVMVYNTVTLNANLPLVTVNMRAPIIVNIEKKLGEQVILNNEKYLVKYPLFKEE